MGTLNRKVVYLKGDKSSANNNETREALILKDNELHHYEYNSYSKILECKDITGAEIFTKDEFLVIRKKPDFHKLYYISDIQDKLSLILSI